MLRAEVIEKSDTRLRQMYIFLRLTVFDKIKQELLFCAYVHLLIVCSAVKNGPPNTHENYRDNN
jgi:hypothetical protein